MARGDDEAEVGEFLQELLVDPGEDGLLPGVGAPPEEDEVLLAPADLRPPLGGGVAVVGEVGDLVLQAADGEDRLGGNPAETRRSISLGCWAKTRSTRLRTGRVK